MRFLQARFKDGTIYEIPAEFIASKIAERAIKYDKELDFQTEFNLAFNSKKDLIEFAENSLPMNIVKHMMKKIKDKDDQDFEYDWKRSEKSIVSHEKW